jgi:rhodanese-related sulfurtransferase
VDFLHFLLNQDNLFIVAIALLSGILLAVSALRKNGRGGTISVTQAIEWINQRQAIWVDVRSPEQYQGGHIAQARNVPTPEIEKKSTGLPKNKPLVVVCEHGRDAKHTVAKFKTLGFTQVVALEGGIHSWSQAGLPMTQKH